MDAKEETRQAPTALHRVRVVYCTMGGAFTADLALRTNATC